MSDKYSDLLFMAIKAGEKRDYQTSIDILTRILSETDSLPEAFLFLGRSYHAVGEYYKAVQSYKFYLNYRSNSPKGLFFLGRTYLALGFYMKSLTCFKKALQISPDNPEILSLAGIAYLKMKKVSAALYYLEQAVLVDSDNKSVYNAYLNVLNIKGVKEYFSGNFSEAEQIFEFLLKTGKNIPSINIYLASSKKEQGKINEALPLYFNVIDSNPDDHLLKLQIIPLLVQAGKNEEAAQLVRELTNKNIPISNEYLDNIDINRVIAIESFNKKKYKTCAFYAKKILRQNYYDSEMHLLIGEAFRNTGNFANAENHYRLVLNRDSKKVEALYGIIMVLWMQEKFRELFDELTKDKKRFPGDRIIGYYYALTASRLFFDPHETISLLEKELEHNDPDAYLYEALGEQYFRISNLKKAEDFFRKSIDVKNNQAAYIGLIKTYHLLGKNGKTGTAFRDYLSLFPDDDKTRKYYINHLYNTGNFKKTVKEIERYSSRYEGDNLITRLLARSYLNIGDYQKAMVIYRQLLRDNPRDVNILLSYAFCIDKNNGPAKAAEILEKARGLIRNSVVMELTLGVLYGRLKNNEKALNCYKKAMEIDENDWRAYFNISNIYKQQGLHDFADKFKNRAMQLKKNT